MIFCDCCLMDSPFSLYFSFFPIGLPYIFFNLCDLQDPQKCFLSYSFEFLALWQFVHINIETF